MQEQRQHELASAEIPEDARVVEGACEEEVAACVERHRDHLLGVALYGVVWRGVVWCCMAWCGVVLYGVVWCGVVWRGVVWWGVV